MELDDWKWPDPPTTPRDIIARHMRNWGKSLAYGLADTLLTELAVRGFNVVHDVAPADVTDVLTGGAAAATRKQA